MYITDCWFSTQIYHPSIQWQCIITRVMWNTSQSEPLHKHEVCTLSNFVSHNGRNAASASLSHDHSTAVQELMVFLQTHRISIISGTISNCCGCCCCCCCSCCCSCCYKCLGCTQDMHCVINSITSFIPVKIVWCYTAIL